MAERKVEIASAVGGGRSPSSFTQDVRRIIDLEGPPTGDSSKDLVKKLNFHFFPTPFYEKSRTYDKNKFLAGLQETPISSLRGVNGFNFLSDALESNHRLANVLEVFLKPDVDIICQCTHTIFVHPVTGKILARGVRDRTGAFLGIGSMSVTDTGTWTTALTNDLTKAANVRSTVMPPH